MRNSPHVCEKINICQKGVNIMMKINKLLMNNESKTLMFT